MRILYFYQYFTTPKGSYNSRVYEFTRRWVQAGHQVTVVTSVFDRSDLRPETFLSRMDVDGIDVRIINIGLSNKHGFLHRVLSFAAFALLACWYALTLPADVVVASSGPITIGLPGLVARYLRGRALIFEVRDLWPEGAIQMGYLKNPAVIWLARTFERLCYRASHTVVTLSEGMADWIRQRYGVQNLAIVPNASDTKLFDQYRDAPWRPDWAEGKRLVVYAGNLGPGDDTGQIVEMARLLLARPDAADVEVVIVGDGRQGAELRQKVREQNLRVRFTGLLPRQQLIRFLGAASCALCVTRSLPFYDTCSPNKLFDALAAGVPMVQTTQGWIKRLLDRESCGITVPQDDPHALADAVWRLLEDPAERRRLGANAVRVAREQFDRDLLARRMLSVVESCVPDSSGHPRAQRASSPAR